MNHTVCSQETLHVLHGEELLWHAEPSAWGRYIRCTCPTAGL